MRELSIDELGVLLAGLPTLLLLIALVFFAYAQERAEPEGTIDRGGVKISTGSGPT